MLPFLLPLLLLLLLLLLLRRHSACWRRPRAAGPAQNRQRPARRLTGYGWRAAIVRRA
jgi:hypothetical protein